MNDMFNLVRTETEKWLLTQFESNSLVDQMDQGKAGQDFVSSLWPFLNPYYSPLNAIYSPLYKNYLSQEEKGRGVRPECLLLRDGAVPLTWFFRNQPVGSALGRYLVHADLARWVPAEWRRKVSFYRVQTKPLKDPDTLILAGPISERVSDLSVLEQTLDRVEAALGKRRMNSIKVNLFCPIRGDGEVFPAKYLQKIISRFRHVNVVDWFYMENVNGLKNTAYVEMNGGWLYQDSFVQQHILSRGAHLLLTSKAKAKCRRVPLSRFHWAEITPASMHESTGYNDDAQLQGFYGKLFPQAENDSAIWPGWHEKWCHAAAQRNSRRG